MYSQLKVILRLHEVGARILGDIDEQTFDGGVEIVGMDGTQKHTLVLGQNRFFLLFKLVLVPLICQKTSLRRRQMTLLFLRLMINMVRRKISIW